MNIRIDIEEMDWIEFSKAVSDCVHAGESQMYTEKMKILCKKELISNPNVTIEIRNTFHTVGIDSFTMYGY